VRQSIIFNIKVSIANPFASTFLFNNKLLSAIASQQISSLLSVSQGCAFKFCKKLTFTYFHHGLFSRECRKVYSMSIKLKLCPRV